MLWILYNVLFAVIYSLMLPHFLMRMWKRGGYRRNFLQRLGIYEPGLIARLGEKRRVWVHAVSVGEIYVALKFIEELRPRLKGAGFVLTTTTSTGYRIAEGRLGAGDQLLYFPADFPVVSRRVLDRIRPLALVLAEGELWPNIIRHARKRGIPVAVINGRMSDSSYRGYRLLRPFARQVLGDINLFLVQSEQDGARFVELGARPGSVRVLGSAKYDVAQFDPDGEARAGKLLALAGILPGDLVVTGGSTWPGEEAVLLSVFRNLKPAFPGLKLVLVPRHAERSVEVEGEIRRSGLSFVKRTDLSETGGEPAGRPDVLLVNTTGELKFFYACASVIFVGKSLTQHGGQNIIEPALYARPVLTGPNMENFREVTADFLLARALIQVQDAAALEEVLKGLLSDRAAREAMGSRAGEVVRSRKGVTGKSAELVAGLVGP